MGFTLKYVQKTPAGTFRYRRRVPDDLKAVIGKRELTEFLGGYAEAGSDTLRQNPRQI